MDHRITAVSRAFSIFNNYIMRTKVHCHENIFVLEDEIPLLMFSNCDFIWSPDWT